MNKAQVAEKVISFIKKEYKIEKVDEDTYLDACGIDDPFDFAFELAKHFDRDECVDGDELEENMCVWHAIDFIAEIV